MFIAQDYDLTAGVHEIVEYGMNTQSKQHNHTLNQQESLKLKKEAELKQKQLNDI